jgi:hypothetical protein
MSIYTLKIPLIAFLVVPSGRNEGMIISRKNAHLEAYLVRVIQRNLRCYSSLQVKVPPTSQYTVTQNQSTPEKLISLTNTLYNTLQTKMQGILQSNYTLTCKSAVTTSLPEADTLTINNEIIPLDVPCYKQYTPRALLYFAQQQQEDQGSYMTSCILLSVTPISFIDRYIPHPHQITLTKGKTC